MFDVCRLANATFSQRHRQDRFVNCLHDTSKYHTYTRARARSHARAHIHTVIVLLKLQLRQMHVPRYEDGDIYRQQPKTGGRDAVCFHDHLLAIGSVCVRHADWTGLFT